MRIAPDYRGYTLLEVVAVIVILGIVSAVVLPQLGSRDDAKAASAARMIGADLRYARSRAMATGKLQYIVFNRDGSGYALADSILPPHLILQPTLVKPFERKFADEGLGNLRSRADFDGAWILAFDAMGEPLCQQANGDATAPLSSGLIWLTIGSTRATVAIEPVTGMIQIR